MLGVAYARDIGDWVVSQGSYEDEQTQKAARRQWAIIVCVSSFYFLDFTLNAVQAICRALILDIPPLWQQDTVNAWSARLSNTATVVGHFTGFMDLVHFLPFFGDTQVKVFCIVAIIVFVVTLSVTCLSTKEKPLEVVDESEHTEWVSEIYFQTHPSTGTGDDEWAQGTRAGSFAMLCYAIVSVMTGVLLPMLVSRDRNDKISTFSLTNIYTMGHIVASGALLSSFYVSSVTGATIVLTVMGIPWAIVLWIPFTLVGEFVSAEDERKQNALASNNRNYGTLSGPSSPSTTPKEIEGRDDQEEFDAGLILGVHNMYIVFPQFAVAIIAALIFSLIGSATPEEPSQSGKSGITFVLAFGGCMSMIAAVVSRYIVRVTK
ncbi:unnamed protein product [Umbelopsis sp. WA50703]